MLTDHLLGEQLEELGSGRLGKPVIEMVLLQQGLKFFAQLELVLQTSQSDNVFFLRHAGGAR